MMKNRGSRSLMNEEEAVMFIRDIQLGESMMNDKDCGRYCLLKGLDVGYQHGLEPHELPSNRCGRYVKGLELANSSEREYLIGRVRSAFVAPDA